MKKISDINIIKVFKDLHNHLLARGLNPVYMILENESSPAFQREIKDKDIELQLSPPGKHRHNAMELAISTIKDHFISGILSIYPDFFIIK